MPNEVLFIQNSATLKDNDKEVWKADVAHSLLATTFAISVLKKQTSSFQHTHASFGRKHTGEQDLNHRAVELLEHTPSTF